MIKRGIREKRFLMERFAGYPNLEMIKALMDYNEKEFTEERMTLELYLEMRAGVLERLPRHRFLPFCEDCCRPSHIESRTSIHTFVFCIEADAPDFIISPDCKCCKCPKENILVSPLFFMTTKCPGLIKGVFPF